MVALPEPYARETFFDMCYFKFHSGNDWTCFGLLRHVCLNLIKIAYRKVEETSKYQLVLYFSLFITANLASQLTQ